MTAMTTRTHYSSSTRMRFPQHLLFNRYEIEGASLRPASGHVLGHVVQDMVEVQRWSGLDTVSDLFRCAGILLKGIDVSSLKDASGSAFSSFFSELRSSLEKVNMSRCFADEPCIIASLCSLTHLTSLNVADNPLLINDEAVELLTETLTKLAILDLGGCTFLSDRSLFSIAKHGNTHLRSLSVRKNNLITDTGANQISTHCENIESVDFSFCSNLKVVGAFEVRKNKAHLFCSRSLQTVALDGCSLAPESFDWLCSSNSKLKRVSLRDASSLSEGSLLGLLFCCPDVAMLHLDGCTSVTGKVMRTMTQKCGYLSDLSISRVGVGISSVDVRSLFVRTAFGLLERLDISENRQLGDETFRDPITGISSVTASEKLTWLNVSHCHFTGAGISSLAKGCRSLRHLDISGLPSVTDAAVRTVVASCAQLREFWMDDSPLVSNSSVIAIAYGLPSLLSLHLSSSVQLTHDSAGDPIRHTQYTDDALEALLDGSRCLQDLTLRNQNGVCFASRWFSRSFPRRAGHFRLQRLDLSGVDLLSVRGAAKVLAHCSDLSEVLLSQRLPHEFRTKRFWQSCFSRAVYAMSYEDTLLLGNAAIAHARRLEAEVSQFLGERNSEVQTRAKTRGPDSPKPPESPMARSMSLSFFSKDSSSLPPRAEGSSPKRGAAKQLKREKREREKRLSVNSTLEETSLAPSLTPSLPLPLSPTRRGRRRSALEEIVAFDKKKARNLNTPHLILLPHARAAVYRYRDMYVRRRLTENHSARIISQAWKVHVFWERIRKRLNARKIATWYKDVLEERRRRKLKRALFLQGTAKTVQRFGRAYLRRRCIAAVSIQRISRGGRARTNLKNLNNQMHCATVIQSWIRGILTRLSDRCLLTQLYLLLPPFWRTVLHSAPYEQDALNPIASSIEAMRRMLEDKKEPATSISAKKDQIVVPHVSQTRAAWEADEGVSIERIRELQGDIKEMSLRTSELLPTDSEMVRRGGGRARLPFHIPQSFDRSSYYSLDDGKHIPIAGVRNILTNAEKQSGDADGVPGRVPIHSFDIKLWPIRGTSGEERSSILLFNPNNDNIKTGMAGPREAILCELCTRRLRLLLCSTCRQGLCFECMFRVHSLHSKRGHTVALLEPRVTLQAPQENTDSCRSLVYHVDLAKQASHLIGDLIKSLGNTVDLQRIKKAKRLAKEYQEEEEAKRILFLQTEEEDESKHLAATRIAFLLLRRKATKEVQDRRIHLLLGSTTSAIEQSHTHCALLQRVFRQYNTRRWLSRWGVRFDPDVSPSERMRRRQPLGHAKITRHDLDVRLGYEEQQRRVMQRMDLVSSMQRQYIEAAAVVATNISHWESRMARMQPIEQAFLRFMSKRKGEHTALSKRKGSPDELHRLMLPVIATETRIVGLREICSLITILLRTSYRRKASLKARYADMEARLEWVGVESGMLTRIRFQIAQRLEMFSGKPDTNQLVDWLRRELELLDRHQASFDSQQESLLQEERGKLHRDEQSTRQLDSFMQELMQSLQWEANMLAEKVALETRVLTLRQEGHGSDEAIRVGQQLLAVRKKLSLLSSNVIDPLKISFQQQILEEDERAQGAYSFPEGSLDFTVAELHKTEAEMVEPFAPSRHVRLTDVTSLYFAQPWLAEEAVKDVRVEEELLTLCLDTKKLEGDLSTLRKVISDGQASIQQYEMRAEDLQIEIEGRGLLNKEPIDDAEQRENMGLILEAMTLELKLQTTEKAVAVQMQGRTESMKPPLLDRVRALKGKQQALNDTLAVSREQRESMVLVFLDNESVFSTSAAPSVRTTLEAFEQLRARTEIARAHCEVLLEGDEALSEVLRQVEGGWLTVEEGGLTGLCLSIDTQRMRGREHLSLLHDRLISKPHAMLREHMACRERTLALDRRVLDSLIASIRLELGDMEAFESQREGHAETTRLLREALLKHRRQRAIQRELDERSSRLKELRDIRLREIAEEAARAAEKERLRKLEEERALPPPRPTYVSKMGAALRKNIRATNDAIRTLRHGNDNAMDEEEAIMAAALQHRGKAALQGRPEGIRRLHITCSETEEKYFQRQNSMLKGKGLPHYVRMAQPLGGRVYLWTQVTFDSRSFVTSLRVSHQTEGHELNASKALRKEGFSPVGNDAVPLEIWMISDPLKTRGLAELAVSTTEAEERKLRKASFEKVEPDEVLARYGIAGSDTYLWMRFVEKALTANIGSAAEATNHLLKEAMRVRMLLKEHPDDPVLQRMSGELAAGLSDSRDKEKAARERDEVSEDPLKTASETMALSEQEMMKFQFVFATLDEEKVGVIALETLCDAIEEAETAFMRDIFLSVDALDMENGGGLEFPDFLKAVSTYCMFGPEEIIRNCFSFADRDCVGFISTEQFSEMLHVIHFRQKHTAQSILLELALPRNQRMSLSEFMEIHSEHPTMLYPIFRLQHRLRDYTMGAPWWIAKLRKYSGVRQKLTNSAGLSDHLVDLEVGRWQEDEARNERLAKRQRAMRHEGSAVKLALLRARQLADELS